MTPGDFRTHIIEYTKSVCPECLSIIDASKVVRDNDVYLSKKCPVHGDFNAIIWRDASSYSSWREYRQCETSSAPLIGSLEGCPYQCGLCPEHQQETCTGIIEVTSRCNLKCPVCFAKTGENSSADDPDPKAIHDKFRTLIKAGGPYPVQLSGGEPTVRDDLHELVSLGSALGFKHIQLNTNGIRLAEDFNYLQRLKDAGLSVVFLQFDAMDDKIYRAIRGRELLSLKLAAIDNCARAKMGVILVPTLVPGVNEHQLGDIIRFAKQRVPVVKGVHFQPITFIGRYPEMGAFANRITLPEIIKEIEIQTGGEIREENFIPPGCEDSCCSFSGVFVLLEAGRLFPLTKFDPLKKLAPAHPSRISAPEQSRKFVNARWRFKEMDEHGACCSCKTLDSSLGANFIERAKSHFLTISAMAFQDSYNLDLKRLRRCCIHVVGDNGRLVPFCAYYLTSSKGRRIYGV